MGLPLLRSVLISLSVGRDRCFSLALYDKFPLIQHKSVNLPTNRIFSTSVANMAKRSLPTGDNPSQDAKKAKVQRSISGFFAASSTSKKNHLKNSKEADVASTQSEYKIFCDLDGVLVDFEAGVKRLFGGRSSEDLPNPGILWGSISKQPGFYSKLPWMSDGMLLWEEIKHLNPDILTGVPRTYQSRIEKFAWCKKELGVVVNHVDMAGKKSTHEIVSGRRKKGVVNVITCWSKNKHFESREKHVLIDDRQSLAEAWEQKGGIFVHHVNTEQTLQLLRDKGILDKEKQVCQAAPPK